MDTASLTGIDNLLTKPKSKLTLREQETLDDICKAYRKSVSAMPEHEERILFTIIHLLGKEVNPEQAKSDKAFEQFLNDRYS